MLGALALGAAQVGRSSRPKPRRREYRDALARDARHGWAQILLGLGYSGHAYE